MTEILDEQKARSKRVHAHVMIILGAIMSACAFAAGLIAMTPGDFPEWMTGHWLTRASAPAYRVPRAPLVQFEEYGPGVFERAKREHRLVLVDMTAFWSRDGRVMEETTYRDPAVVAWIGEHAVAARVDAESDPKFAARYGAGPLPETILLDENGAVVSAGAFLTPKLFLPWADLNARRRPSTPEAAAALDARWNAMLAQSRSAFKGVENQRWERDAAPLDSVWGGVFGRRASAASSRGGFEKTIADQARFIAQSRDREAVRRTLDFVEKFMTLPKIGYASSVRGEAETNDGRVMEGFAYFALDDAGRRAVGLPSVDRRLLKEGSVQLARAILACPEATAPQKAHAKAALAAFSIPKS